MPNPQEPRQSTSTGRIASVCAYATAPSMYAWLNVVRCRVVLHAQWVLNPECSCNGGKNKLQAPISTTRSGSTVKFTCTHTSCRSFHGGVCPHFQMCPHWYDICQSLVAEFFSLQYAQCGLLVRFTHGGSAHLCMCSRLVVQSYFAFHQLLVQW